MFRTEVVEKIKTLILFSINFFSENRVVYEKMWENIVQPEKPQIIVWQKASALT